MVVASYTTTFAIKLDGTLWAWGQGFFGTGQAINVSYVPVMIGSGYQSVATGGSHVLALKSDGSLFAWGPSASGELGFAANDICNPGTNSTYPCSYTAQLAGTGFAAIAAGGNSSYALRADGTLSAWGNNQNGQLGDGTLVNRSAPIQVATGIASISAGQQHASALTVGGTLLNWGEIGGALIPTAIGNGFTSISAGYYSTVGVKSDGTVWAIGQNAFGKFGGAGAEYLSTLRQFASGAMSVAADQGNAAYIALDGTLWVSGDNSYGQLGIGTVVNHSTPVQIGTSFSAIAVGGAQTTVIGVKTNGTLWAWGDNNSGLFGDGTSLYSGVPKQIGTANDYRDVAMGQSHAISLKRDGSIWGWGNNYFGQVGVGAAIGSSATPIIIDQGYSAVSVGTNFTMALKTNSELYVWGLNTSGQLGVATSDNCGDVSTLISCSRSRRVVGSGFKFISAGASHSAAIKSDGTLWMWGDNSAGQLGVATTEICREGTNYTSSTVVYQMPCSTTPKLVGTNFIAVSAGYQHTLALKTDGSLWAWGTNYWGYLGDGQPTGAIVAPKKIGSGYSKIVGGGYVSFALRPDGTAWSWGSNAFGALGDGTYANRPSPIVIRRENGAGSIAGNDWYLDLDPVISKTIAAANRPAFLATATGSGTTIDAKVQYRAQDIGTTGSVYVFALAPASMVKIASRTTLTPLRMKVGPTENGVATGTSDSCVLAQLNSSGQLVSTSADSLQAYLTGVLTSQGASVSVLNGVSSALLQGATFFVGYGTTPTSMFNGGVNLSVLTIGQLQACTTPDAFSFVPQSGVALNLPITSSPVTIGGTNFVAAPINITNGSYRINNGPFVQSVGLISRGDIVTMQVLSSSEPSAQTCANLNVSGVTGPFCVTTMQASLTNYALAVSSAGIGAGTVTSSPAGISCGADCSKDFSSGTTVSLIAAPSVGSTFSGWSGACSGTADCTATMNGAKSVTATYALVPGPSQADPFSFLPQTGAGPNQAFTSNAITITGLNASAPISIANGSYRINGGPFTADPGNINNGDNVTVQGFSSPYFNAQACATLNIGGVNGLFCVMTAPPVLSMSVSTTSLSFPTQVVGTGGLSQSVALTNSGNDTLSLTSISASGDFTLASNCGVSLGVGGTCSINVTFAPTTIGTRTGMITISSNAIGSPRSVILSGIGVTVPDAPAGLSTIAGNSQASIVFNTPASDGGSAITGYLVNCTPGPVSMVAFASPITVTGLTNNVNYVCSITASNAFGMSFASVGASVTPSASIPFILTSVRSRKSHGSVGSFDLPLDTSQAVGGLVTVEPRNGSSHDIVFQFNGPVTSPGNVSITPFGTVSASPLGNEVLVTVTNVPDKKRVTVTLTNVNGSTPPTPVSIGFLVGDVNNSRSVNLDDVRGVKSRSGQTADAWNFKYDVNASGAINSSDVSTVKARLGLVLP